jgi:tRNA (guanine-N7-)-methyltransferase
MSTTDYIPPERPLLFHPKIPPVDGPRPPKGWILEIGPGKGELLLSLAQENPQTNFLAVEYKKARFLRIARRIDRLELKNLFIVYGDARECLSRLCPDNFFEKIYVLFPDPWPKKRHIKHRLLKPRLVNQLRCLLKDGGEVINATDAGFYSEQIIAAFDEVGGFQREAIYSPYPTYFEKKWRGLGRDIDYWRFIKMAG